MTHRPDFRRRTSRAREGIHRISGLIAGPPPDLSWEGSYRLSPREKRSYHTILDAHNFLDEKPDRLSSVRIRSHESNGSRLVDLEFDHPIRGGRISETLVCRFVDGGLVSHSLVRSAYNEEDRRGRHEDVGLSGSTTRFPGRSEEPRVGEGGWSRGVPYHSKKKFWMCKELLTKIGLSSF